MKKHVLYTIFFSVLMAFLAKAQETHSQWKLSSKKINDCEYLLIFTVALDKGWHTFSVQKIKDTDGEVFPTEIIFKPNKDISLVGALSETKAKPEYDKTIKKTVLLHYNKAVFTQRVKINTGAKVKISGTYQIQICNDRSCSTLPYETFDFNLQGTAACTK